MRSTNQKQACLLCLLRKLFEAADDQVEAPMADSISASEARGDSAKIAGDPQWLLLGGFERC
jgi:hypothetical protein